MRCLDLFAGGCNGFGLAAQWMGWQTVACVEIDKFNQKLLKQNFPESEIYGDIREFNRSEAAKYRGRIDLITGGDPCQPSSLIGLQRGIEDEKYLWPEMLETLVENKNGVLCPISDLHREYDAVPFSMERIKALGNAVVPQIPYEIYKAIESTFL